MIQLVDVQYQLGRHSKTSHNQSAASQMRILMEHLTVHITLASRSHNPTSWGAFAATGSASPCFMAQIWRSGSLGYKRRRKRMRDCKMPYLQSYLLKMKPSKMKMVISSFFRVRYSPFSWHNHPPITRQGFIRQHKSHCKRSEALSWLLLHHIKDSRA